MPNLTIRSLFERAGLTLRRRWTQPRGLDLYVDLGRLWSARPPAVLFDVGANLGQTARQLIAAYPRAVIHSFEPVGATYHELVKNIAPSPRFHAHPIALGARDGIARIEAKPGSGTNRLLADGANLQSATPIENVTLRQLDNLCAELDVAHIDLLKTDCEGHDLEVLRGATSLLKAGAIDCIYCEVNFRRDGIHGDFFAIEDFLCGSGYAFYALYDYSGWQYDVAREGFANALFIRAARAQPLSPTTT